MSVSGEPPIITNAGYFRSGPSTLCQIYAAYFQERAATISTNGSVVFADAADVTIGTTLVDQADGDKYIAQAGGTVVDTVAYENLVPNTEYAVTGELFDKATGAATGITGSTTFITGSTGTGEVAVSFVLDADQAGKMLVAFEVVTQGDVEIAVHEGIDDAAQTVTVDNGGLLAITGLSPVILWIVVAGGGALLAGAVLLIRRCRTV